jgi:alkylation response protein AidB-like acyl-CoA dehydrogenase
MTLSNACFVFSLMQAALDVVVPYVHERRQFGVPIGEFQVKYFNNFQNALFPNILKS